MTSKRGSLLASMLLAIALTSWFLPNVRVDAAEDYGSLQAAIEAANSSSDSGTITLTDDITLSAALPPITGQITLEGGDHSISGDGIYRIFDVSGGALVINNLTMTGGRAEIGGAIRLRNDAQVTVENSTLSDNAATHGGAVATSSDGDRLKVDNSSFISNKADEYAGAIYAYRGEITITTSSFVKNSSAWVAGAIYGINRSISISNSTFSQNQASGPGGALDLSHGDVTLTHLTFTNNRSVYATGDAISNSGGRVSLRNSIIAGGGPAEDCVGGLIQNQGNLSLDGSCGIRPSDDPMLEDLTGSPAYHLLQNRSPAVDAADPSFCLGSDQVGTTRPHGGGCDIGAIESTTASPALPTPVPPVVCTLAYQIIAANTDRAAGGCPAGRGADTITLSKDYTLFSPLPAITSHITIEGSGHAISGDKKFRIFNVDGGKLTVNNLTLTEGKGGSGNGGAIRVQGRGQAIVNSSHFIKNWAEYGGAIMTIYPSVGLTIRNSSFVGNTASWDGGAIAKYSGTVTITNSSFIGNVSSISGGAIYTSSSGKIDVMNSTFIDNRSGKGGAVYASGAITTLTHVTMLNGGIWIYDDDRTLNLRNSIIAGHGSADDCHGRLTQNVGNFIADGSCTPSLSGDPMLEEVTGSQVVLALQAGSPAIDAAHPAFCLDTDQIGTRRPQGGGCDIGAFELTPVIEDLSECSVTTTHVLNMRDGPYGNRIGSVPENATLTATARTPGWFNVDNDGGSGWISADYVTQQGDCG